jgi:signal transduction histidine kinase
MGLVNRFPNRGDFYGTLAFAGTGLGAFSAYAFAFRIRGETWEVALTFLLGGLFILGGSFSRYLVDDQPLSRAWAYALGMSGLGLATVIVSPLTGFFYIILLPLASQVIFIFPWKISLPWGLGCYLTTCLLYQPRYGWDAVVEALISYSPAYVFTMVFSYVTRDALLAREHAMALKEELETANTQLRAHAAQAEELATTRERNRLAREIHDGVGHYLTVISVQLEAAEKLLAQDDTTGATTAINKATTLSRDALDDVRRSVGSLRTEEKRPPLDEAIRQLTVDAGVNVNLAVSGQPRLLSEAVTHALFRAAQEGLTNIRKHARAEQSWITLDYADPARTRLTVEDDGRGPAFPAPCAGYGLRGMHERIELLGGRVQSGPRSAGGFTLSVEVPA